MKTKKKNDSRNNENRTDGKEFEAVRAYSSDSSPLGSYTGTPAQIGGKRYVSLASIAPLINSLGQSVPELMMPPVLPSENDTEGIFDGEPAGDPDFSDLSPTQDADDL